MASALESALDALYLVAPEQFMETRKALAAQLGKGPDAKEVLEQKKPTKVAHVLNRLVRDCAAEVADLAKIGERLSHAHQGAQPEGLREVIAEQRAAVAALRASALMSELGVAAHELSVINAVLQAATTSAERAAELARGRFSKAPDANVSFFGGVAMTSAPSRSPEPAQPEPKLGKVKAGSEEPELPLSREEDREAEARAREKWAQAEQAARKAAERAEDEARASQEQVEALEAEQKQLDVAAEDAASVARRAKHDAEEAEERVKEAREEAKRHAKFAAALRAEHRQLEREGQTASKSARSP